MLRALMAAGVIVAVETLLALDHEGQRAGDWLHSLPDARHNRKLVFINNKEYDLSQEEEAHMWHLYRNKGYALNAAAVAATAQEEPGDATVLPPVSSTTASPPITTTTPFSSTIPDPNQQKLVKSSRFVADPMKALLIEDVDKDELQALSQVTEEPVVAQRVTTNASTTETVTVHYEATRVSVLSFLWTELRNLGELLGRELVDTVGGRLQYLWRSLLRAVGSGHSLRHA